MVTSLVSDAATKSELLEIISNGRKFLQALETFAATKFPQDGNEGTAAATILANTNHHHHRNNNDTATIAITPAANAAALATITTTAVFPPTGAPQRQTQQCHPSQFKRTPQRSKVVLQYCAKTGRQTGRFESQCAAAKAMTLELPPSPSNQYIKHTHGISKTLSGHRKQHRGFYFHYEYELNVMPLPVFPITYTSAHPRHDRYRQIQQTTGDVVRYCGRTGNILGSYATASIAGRELAGPNADRYAIGACSRSIKKVCMGMKPHHNGDYFQYTSDKSPLPSFPIIIQTTHTVNTANASTTTTAIPNASNNNNQAFCPLPPLPTTAPTINNNKRRGATHDDRNTSTTTKDDDDGPSPATDNHKTGSTQITNNSDDDNDGKFDDPDDNDDDDDDDTKTQVVAETDSRKRARLV